MESYMIKKATVEDVHEIVKLRRIMFESMGYTNKNQLEKADISAERYFYESFQNKSFHGWVAKTAAGNIISTVGAVIDQHPPGPSNLSGKIAYIMNLCTIHEYRRQGIACELMKTAIEWIKQNDLSVISLHSTDMGRKLYEQLGFTNTNEMRLIVSG